ncbi:hypothetical protein CEXT_696501 [Caerostris extrusa]|uniref:Uncharacterized protein n=1 Tax=Caerostris extrusa TaxID=172846 RepID=A0AAV4XIB2_CAEEX|nr:hypothetical protein CEXT_696501 [Caerostris extrusa]
MLRKKSQSLQDSDLVATENSRGTPRSDSFGGECRAFHRNEIVTRILMGYLSHKLSLKVEEIIRLVSPLHRLHFGNDC